MDNDNNNNEDDNKVVSILRAVETTTPTEEDDGPQQKTWTIVKTNGAVFKCHGYMSLQDGIISIFSSGVDINYIAHMSTIQDVYDEEKATSVQQS